MKSCSLACGKFKVVEEKCGEKHSDLPMAMMVRKKFLFIVKVVFNKYLGLLDFVFYIFFEILE